MLKRGVRPRIQIQKNDATFYTYDKLNSNFDFRIQSLQFTQPVDAAGAKFSMTIAGATGQNSEMATILANVQVGNEVTFALGKQATGQVSLARFIIEEALINLKGRNFTPVTLSGPDWGSALLKHTVVNGSWIQKKQSNGVDLDMTDTSTKLKTIISELVSNTSKYPVRSDGITAATKGLVYNSANVTPPDYTVPQFYANMEFLDDKLSEIDEIAGTIHYVDFNKNLIVKSPTLTSSGILLTDDTADTVASGWDTTKLGYIESVTYTPSLELHRRRMFGLGGDQRLEVDQQRQLTTTTSDKIDTLWRAIKFQPYYANIESVAVYVDKTGTPSDLNILVTENDANVANGQPIVSKPLISKNIDKEKIAASPGWHYIQVNQDVDIGKFYWVVLQRTNDASHYYNWYRTSGSSAYTTATSSDGITWARTPSTDGYAFRAVSTNPLLIAYPAVGLSSSKKHFFEEVIRRPDITQVETMEKLLLGLMQQVHQKQKLIVKANVYVPDTILQVGQTVRVRVQKGGYNFDDNFTIGDMTYRFDTALGYLYQDIVLSKFAPYV